MHTPQLGDDLPQGKRPGHNVLWLRSLCALGAYAVQYQIAIFLIPFRNTQGAGVELRALRAFVAVAEAGTVTDGAAELGVGQPAVTRQIQVLERELKIKLFDREDGRLRLSAAGLDVLPVAQTLLHQADDVLAAARGVAAGRLQHVRIVSVGTTRDDVLAPWLATWDASAPMPSITEMPLDQVYPALRGRADFAVAPTAPPSRLASRVVADLNVWACVPPSHEWAQRHHVTLTDLTTEPLLLLNRQYHARRRLDWAANQEGMSVEPSAEFASPVVAQAVAASGRGVCVLTDDARFDLVPLPIVDGRGRPLTVRLYAAWEKHHHASATLSELADDLATFTQTRYAD